MINHYIISKSMYITGLTLLSSTPSSPPPSPASTLPSSSTPPISSATIGRGLRIFLIYTIWQPTG